MLSTHHQNQNDCGGDDGAPVAVVAVSDALVQFLVPARDACCDAVAPPHDVPALMNGCDYSQFEPDGCHCVVLVDCAMRVLHLPPLL